MSTYSKNIKAKNKKTINKLIKSADIIQLEWWNHPAIFQFLCTHNFPKIRLLVWCHVSGLYTPIIPIKLISSSSRFLFTSACSYKSDDIISLNETDKLKLGVVSSGTGFTPEKPKVFKSKVQLNYGYMGSLNTSKLHPRFIDYLSGVSISNFKVGIWGDDFYKDDMVFQCEEVGNPNLIKFNGYTTSPASTLLSLDIFIYLLNPNHYGTAENVLLEAMSLGVIPIVLNNPAEIEIVKNRETGLIVSSKNEFVEAINWLENNPDERKRISINASKIVAEKYTLETMFQSMKSFYDQNMSLPKSTVNFNNVLGSEPYEWYMACQKYIDIELDNSNKNAKNSENEETKGSLRHYLDYFPYDSRLNRLLSDL